ncbi:hypothetical protein AHAS_Ahas09G0167900 [Arachis hypogaea]
MKDQQHHQVQQVRHDSTDHHHRSCPRSTYSFKFRTLWREGLKTQNSVVLVTSDTRSYASRRDNNVAVGGMSYYEKLADIIELNYSRQFTVVLFRCIWANTTSGREDDEPYILASEAHLVYYVEDEVDKEWNVVVHYNMVHLNTILLEFAAVLAMNVAIAGGL